MKFNEDNQGSLPKIIILNEPIVCAALTAKKDLYERWKIAVRNSLLLWKQRWDKDLIIKWYNMSTARIWRPPYPIFTYPFITRRAYCLPAISSEGTATAGPSSAHQIIENIYEAATMCQAQLKWSCLRREVVTEVLVETLGNIYHTAKSKEEGKEVGRVLKDLRKISKCLKLSLAFVCFGKSK